MSTIETFIQLWETQRARTESILERVEKTERAQEVLGWRPGSGRAHIAWQIMHIGITEEVFATERLDAGTPDYPELVPRFKGGSTPDDEIPALPQIREVLAHSREHWLKTIRTFSDQDLENIPPGTLQERGWTLQTLLHILSWHEAHHQGQAHLTLNLWSAAQENA
jgi:uncharacterized damage-inducible protein DinB